VAYWTIRSFRDDRGRDAFDEAYRQQSATVRAEFRAVLNGLKAQREITGWARENGFDLISGKKWRKYRGLGKLRFKVDRVQHRPLGFFGPSRHEFTLLAWATEREGEFNPRGVLDLALRRMNQVIKQPERANECDF
jgi:hypothetical protein